MEMKRKVSCQNFNRRFDPAATQDYSTCEIQWRSRVRTFQNQGGGASNANFVKKVCRHQLPQVLIYELGQRRTHVFALASTADAERIAIAIAIGSARWVASFTAHIPDEQNWNIMFCTPSARTNIIASVCFSFQPKEIKHYFFMFQGKKNWFTLPLSMYCICIFIWRTERKWIVRGRCKHYFKTWPL